MTKLNIRRNGKLLTNRQVTAFIRKELRLSKKAYNKYYDITRNKLRNYENVTGAKKQSVTQFLYNRAQYKAKARSEGLRYTKSAKARYIESFSSKSSGIKNIGQREQYNIEKRTRQHISKTMGTFIKDNEGAKTIHNFAKGDPLKELEMLKAYAEKRKEYAENEKGEIQLTSNAPFARGASGGTNGELDDEALDEVLYEYGGGGL